MLEHQLFSAQKTRFSKAIREIAKYLKLNLRIDRCSACKSVRI